MNILRNFNKYSQGVTIDLKGQVMSFKGKLSQDSKIIGLYAELSKTIIGLFKSSDNELSILIGNKIFPAKNKLKVNFNTKNKQSHIHIIHNKIEILNISYKTPEPISTLWHTEDTEDSDFGEWLFNVLNSELRKSIFIENKENFE